MGGLSDTRFNIISEAGDGAGFAVRLRDEGFDSRLWIRDADAKSIADGLVDKVGDLEDLLHGADTERDVFIFDGTGNGATAEYLTGLGFGVIGGSLLADRIERNRKFGTEVMLESGIDIPETQTFEDFDDAVAYAEKHAESRWVYKPSKQLGDLSPSYVSYDTEDLVEMLTNVRREVDIEDVQFELQEFVAGVALSTELWFQKGALLPLTNHTLERKELMNDNLGPTGGCLGNVVWMCDGCRVCDIVKRLVPWMERRSYHGMVDLNAIVASDGSIYGLEFTPRFGYDAAPTFLWELVKGGLGPFLASIARGGLTEFEVESEAYAAGLRISLPPWPSEKYHADENVPVRGLTGREHTYFYNVKEGEAGLASAGAWGILMLLTGRGATVGRAFSKPLAQAQALRVKNKQYRTDLVKVFEDDLAKLEESISLAIH